AHGLPRFLGRAASRIPDRVAAALALTHGPFRVLKGFEVPSLIEQSQNRLRTFLAKVDHVVAVCQWVHEMLERNGVPADKITLSRQGFAGAARRPARVTADPSRPLSIAYFGRVDHSKGPDLLVSALSLIPEADVLLDIYAVRQPGSERAIAWL